jgi:hypothetical protein
MTAAIFALLGTLLGISGTLLIELRRERTQYNRSLQEALRISCADFSDTIIRVRELAVKLRRNPSDPALQESAQTAHSEAWVHYERLRLISTSRDVQEAGRRVLRYSWGYVREVKGEARRDDETDAPFSLIHEWLQKFYVAARHELGVPNADNVYAEPLEWRMPPTSIAPHQKK